METYLIKASAILGIFLLTYQLLLRNETFFKLNRFFLLSGVGAALLLPLVSIREEIPIPVELMQAPSSLGTTSTGKEPVPGWDLLLWTGYLLGAFYFMALAGKQLWSLRGLMRNAYTERKDGFILVPTHQIQGPFSFFRYIFYNPGAHDEAELQQVLEHEKVHARQLHSLDVLLGRTTAILLWLNPFAWWYQKSMQQNLEYLADAQAVQKLTSVKEYQYTLLKVSGNTLTPALVNSFYSSLIKKRIVMLQQNQSKTIHLVKYLLILPVMAAFLMAFNREVVYVPEEPSPQELYTQDHKIFEVIIDKNTSDTELSEMKEKLKKDNIDFSYTAVRNESGEIIDISFNVSGKTENGNPFSGNYAADSDTPIKPMMIKITSSGGIYFGDVGSHSGLHQSKDLHFDSNSGKTMVWVQKSGDSENEVIEIRKEKGKEVIILNGKEVTGEELHEAGDAQKIMIRTLGEGADSGKEVIVKEIRTTKDGDHEQIMILGPDAHGNHTATKKMKVHVSTDSDEEVKTITINTDEEGGVDFSDSNALFFIDGKKASRKDVKNLDPEQIKTISVWKGPEAVEKYGKKAADGVIEITTKKQ
ncbi:MAG: M56 family metallopeptidase [Robiginitalea sp.]